MIRWKTFAIGWSLALALLLFAARKTTMPDPNAYRDVVDLTHNLNDHSPNWEGSDESPFHAKQLGNIEHDGYYSRIFTTQEHYGTHLDAPAHFARGMWTVDQIPAERLVRPLVVLNVRSKATGHPDYEVSVQDVADWESRTVRSRQALWSWHTPDGTIDGTRPKHFVTPEPMAFRTSRASHSKLRRF